jgi:MFS transporter, DHA2 family, multidrug resistance protein
VVNTWLQDNARIQAARMGESLGEAGHSAPDTVAALAGKFGAVTSDPQHALLLAQGEFAKLVGRTALTSSFDEVFRMMAWIFLAALVMVPFCRPVPTGAAAVVTESH